jgi:hypothetical protein
VNAARAAADARLAAAKAQLSAAARAALAGEADAPALVERATREFNTARAELARLAAEAAWASSEGATVSMGLRFGIARRARESLAAFRDRLRARIALDKPPK